MQIRVLILCSADQIHCSLAAGDIEGGGHQGGGCRGGEGISLVMMQEMKVHLAERH